MIFLECVVVVLASNAIQLASGVTETVALLREPHTSLKANAQASSYRSRSLLQVSGIEGLVNDSATSNSKDIWSRNGRRLAASTGGITKPALDTSTYQNLRLLGAGKWNTSGSQGRIS